jgi:hypothetical protein
MKYVLSGIAIICLFISTALKAQSPLFTAISDNEAKLTAQQLTKLQNLRTNPAYESITMVQMANLWTVQQDGTLLISIPGKPTRMAVANVIENPSRSRDGDLKWEGAFFLDTSYGGVHDTTGDGEITIYRKAGRYYGTINLPFDPDTYELASFEPGKTALIKYDLHHTQSLTCGEPNEGEPEITQRETASGCGTIRVLVLYTAAAANAVVDIAGTAQHCIDDMNGTVYNSEGSTLNFDYALAGVEYLENFQEVSDASKTLGNLKIFTAARAMRDHYAADLVVLLTDGNFPDPEFANLSILGLSYQGINPENGYSIVEADAANNNYCMNHELGHLMGCRHQQDFISATPHPDNTPGNAHGFRMIRRALFSPNTNYITMMHENNGIKRSHLFSTPYYQIWGHDMGTVDENYNAQAALINSCAVNAYRPDESREFAAAIQPDHYLNFPGNNVHFTATTNGVGIMPYTYHWYISPDGNVWTAIPGGSTADFTMPYKKRMYVMVDIYDAYGLSSLTTNHVNGAIANVFDPYNWTEPAVFTPGVGRMAQPQPADNFTVYPNPAENTVTLSYVPATANWTGGALRVYSADGKRVYAATVDGSHPSVTINVGKFANGVYFAELSTDKHIADVKFVINH